jgi:hypothetical protein
VANAAFYVSQNLIVALKVGVPRLRLSLLQAWESTKLNQLPPGPEILYGMIINPSLHMLMCDTLHTEWSASMPTNLAIDDRLVDEARRIGAHATKKEAVTAALQEYIQRRKQMKILKLFGSIDYDPAYDSKKTRQLDRIEVEL